MNVLIVERDELVAEVLATALEEEGIEVAIVDDDKKALETCEPEAPQEDMAGLVLVHAMRRRCPLLRVIYMAAIWPAQLHRCALGVRDRFVSKPVPLSKLVRTVRELLPA